MDPKQILNIIKFVGLLLAQIVLFNHINFLGYINPYIYILFVVWFPIRNNRAQFLLVSFLLGLLIDIFSDSLAINAAATVTIAYLRPAVLRFAFGVNYEFQNFKLSSATMVQKMAYLLILIVVHHLILFSIEIFSFMQIGLILKKTLLTSIFTFVVAQLFSSLFLASKK